MTPEEWKRVRPVLESALELEPSSRARFLDGACADAALRREVESLIASYEQAGTVFPTSGSVMDLDLASELQFRLSPGKRIGPYEILDEIAVGGMGAVYRAVRADGQYRQQVALKIVRAELGAELTATRFKNERQILASLDHPNIARILDGGTTTEGLPYFVMELIEGLPITQYCDQEKLSVQARVNLFRVVCSAVQYAHQHLVIHRDIKPTNILIVAGGVPKLLDFGIAKILDPNLLPENALATEAGMWLMTPEYASPEQFRGGAITTATDVYSLGAVLYELLTGHPAHRFANRMPHEMARSVVEAEPVKPSTVIRRREEGGGEGKEDLTPERVSELRGETPEKLRRRLAGDLDNIVMKAIRKEPGQRYVSVDQLSEDLRRHVEGLPVAARKSTLGYRCRKYVVRHKVGVTAAGLVLASLLTGLVLTVQEARIARANAVRAEKRFNDVRKLANSLLFDIHDRIRDLPGSIKARQAIVNSALEYLDSLSQEAGGDPGLQRELATAYERVGDVQGNPYYANLGDVGGALTNYRKAMAIRQPLAKLNPKNDLLQRELSGSYNKIGVALDGLNDFPGALANYEESARILDRVAKDSPDPMARDQLAGAYFYEAIAARETGDLNLALESARKATSIRETIHTDVPAQRFAVQSHSAGDHAALGLILRMKGDPGSALVEQRKVVAITTSLSQENPYDATTRSFLGQGYFTLAQILTQMGQATPALDALREAKGIFEPLLSFDPANAFVKEHVALIYELSGRLQAASGKPEPGLEDLKKALAMLDEFRSSGAIPENMTLDFAITYDGLGRVYATVGGDSKAPVAARIKNLKQARQWYQKSIATWSEMRGRGTLEPLDEQEFEKTTKSLADCAVELKKLGAAAL